MTIAALGELKKNLPSIKEIEKCHVNRQRLGRTANSELRPWSIFLRKKLSEVAERASRRDHLLLTLQIVFPTKLGRRQKGNYIRLDKVGNDAGRHISVSGSNWPQGWIEKPQLSLTGCLRHAVNVQETRRRRTAASAKCTDHPRLTLLLRGVRQFERCRPTIKLDLQSHLTFSD